MRFLSTLMISIVIIRINAVLIISVQGLSICICKHLNACMRVHMCVHIAFTFATKVQGKRSHPFFLKNED